MHRYACFKTFLYRTFWLKEELKCWTSDNLVENRACILRYSLQDPYECLNQVSRLFKTLSANSTLNFSFCISNNFSCSLSPVQIHINFYSYRSGILNGLFEFFRLGYKISLNILYWIVKNKHHWSWTILPNIEHLTFVLITKLFIKLEIAQKFTILFNLFSRAHIFWHNFYI